MKKNIFSLLLILCLLTSSFSAYAAGPGAGVGKDEIPYGPNDPTVQGYGYSSFNMMTQTEAASSGVPTGYSGYVLALTNGNGNAGFMLDFEDRKIPVYAIESITFRVWCSANTKEVRITDNKGSGWIMRAVPEAREEWIDISLTIDGDHFCDGYDMSRFADKDGYFKPVNFGFRFTENVSATVYIDSITVHMREPDTKAPEITYNGETELHIAEGNLLSVTATAFDKYEDATIEVKQLWSEGALDSEGKLKKGNHTCILQATDRSGNVSEVKLTVHVGEKDTAAPVICFASDSIHVKPGSFNMLKIAATDNNDGATVVLTWSDGCFDSRERFVEGEHTLTVTATDLSGNRAEKVITVSVSDAPAADNLICDTE